MRERKKIYWWSKRWLFYKVGWSYDINGEETILARYWRWKKNSKKKAVMLAAYYKDKDERNDD